MLLDFNVNDMSIKYGLYNIREERELAKGSLGYILSDFDDIKTRYFYLGFHLDEFIRCKYYEDFGYLSFKEFAVENIPLDYSSINRCISVFNMICERSSSVKKMFMQDKYKSFSYSQLVEMVNIPENKRACITSDMSVRKIREFKSNNVKSESCDVAIDSFDFIYDIKEMLKKKYSSFDIKNISYTDKILYFQYLGKQYEVSLLVKEI